MNTAAILSNLPVSPTVRRLALRVDGAFRFQAGQFVILPVPPAPGSAADAKPAKGFYSVASPPGILPSLELLVEHREGGGWVSDWISARGPGEQLKLEGPLGHFGLMPGANAPRVFLCLRAGLAPLRSMLLQGLAEDQGEHWLFLGGAGEADWLLHEEWRAMAADHPRFHYHPLQGGGAELAAAAAGAVPLKAQCYAAGFNADVAAVQAGLLQAGFGAASMKLEKFG
ncbi:MAG TPA: FAD-dependent oxidoreductase [bacterium]|jgi:ferredoxin-NADP reductase|nr:FAD-dependent oxidoreductase [bacterium]